MKNTAILFVTDSFHIGGVTVFMEQHGRAAAKLGHTIVIIGAPHDLDKPRRMFPYATVKVLPVGPGYGTIVSRIRWFLSTLGSIHTVYRTYNVRLFYAPLSRSYIIGMLHPNSWRIPRIYAFCGDVALEKASAAHGVTNWRLSLKNIFHYVLQQFVVYTANTIVTFSTYAHDLLRIRYPLVHESKIVVIPAYVTDVLSKSHQSESIPSILMVSRFEPRKGVDTALNAMAILKKKHVKFHFTLVGSFETMYTPDFLELYERLNLFTSVSILHKASDEQLKSLLAFADVCIVPSKDLETFGVMTLTALANGVPVIGTPVGATPEILGPIDKRLISRGVAPEDLAKSLYWFLKLSQKERNILQGKIFTDVTSRYRFATISEQIQHVFSSLLMS